MVVFTDHLQNVADDEVDARLGARDQVVLTRVVREQCSHENLKAEHQVKMNMFDTREYVNS